MTEMPNSGVKIHLGGYKVSLRLVTGYGRTRNLTIESDGDLVGLYPDELIDQLQIDIENLRETAKRCVVDAKVQREKEDEEYKCRAGGVNLRQNGES